jgi:hypothetical protein
MKQLSYRARALLTGIVCLAFGPTAPAAETWDSTPHQIVDIRSYSDGAMLIRYTPGNAALPCSWPDYGYLYPDRVNAKTLSALLMTAYLTRRLAYFIFDGCTPGGVPNLVGMTMSDY